MYADRVYMLGYSSNMSIEGDATITINQKPRHDSYQQPSLRAGSVMKGPLFLIPTFEYIF